MKISFNFKPDSKVTLSANGQAETVDLDAEALAIVFMHGYRYTAHEAAVATRDALACRGSAGHQSGRLDEQ